MDQISTTLQVVNYLEALGATGLGSNLHFTEGYFLGLFQEVFNFLLRSFHAAHSLIVQEEGTLTNLTACVVLPISDSKNKEGKITM